jgi:hypothetical protein
MKMLIALMVILLSVECRAQIEDKDPIEQWKKCPEGAPLPTLDHHLGKIAGSIALYSTLRVAGVRDWTALGITSAAGIAFEAVQYLFFDETLNHSLMDVVLFNYHLPMHAFTRGEALTGIGITVNLTGLYLYFLTRE